MGCSSDKFETEVRKETFAYINALSITSEQKDSLKVLINDDLRKKSAAFRSYPRNRCSLPVLPCLEQEP